jgi:NAD(P)-dependent dehydrogenase (short-subunit alcohol dehydrogenase family)
MPSAVVLGARNLGAAIARGLLADGYRVASVARTATDLELLEAEGAVGIRADAADPASLAAAFDRAAGEIGAADVAVNAVSLRPPDDGGPFGGGALAAASPDAFDAWTVPVARQAFLFLSAGARALAERGGTLVQVTGAPARRAAPERGLLAAGQAALRALAHAAAQEHRRDGVRVKLLIVDGIIESPKTARMTEGMPREALVRQDDVVDAIRYLASQSARGLSHELVLTPAGGTWVP